MKFLFDNFDILAQAPGGVKKLREMILQLAVQGKLVPQNPKDEPASILLEKIKKEKGQLLKEGKIKKQKPLEPIKGDDAPFELPTGWEFVRLGELANRIGSGSTPRGGQSVYIASGIPFLRSQNIWNSGLELCGVACIPENIHNKMFNTVVIPNDILLNITGASLGRCTIYPDSIGEANVSQHVSIIRPTLPDICIYLHFCIISPYIQNLVWSRQVGMAREGLSKKVLELFEIPLPPLAEQKRIVAKVDSLMALCDDLEKQQQEKTEKKLKLNKASLHELHSSITKQDFNKNWNHITKNFDLLYNTSENVNDLKQSILQLAVQGKLTKDWRNAHTVVESQKKEILKSFKNQDEIQTGRKKFLKEVTQVIFEDKKTPKNWVKSQFFNLCLLKRGHDLPKRKRKKGRYVVASSGGINGYHNEYIVEEGVVIGRSGSTGKPHYIEGKHWPLNTVLYGEDYCGNSKKYVYLFLKAFDFTKYSSSTAVPTLNRNKLLNKLILIPPLAEQKRIVAKVDSLMILCDQLSQKVINKENRNEKLLNSVVSQL